jgi:hypothetical protein
VPDRPLSRVTEATSCCGHTLLRFFAPTAYEVAGSDLHRACLTRLRCVSRLSQPHDALIPPVTLPVLFRTGDTHGVRPSEVSPPRPPGHLSAPLSPPDVVVDDRARRSPEPAPSPCRHASSYVAPKSDFSSARKDTVGFGRVFRGFSPFRESVLRSAGVSRTMGADPLVGFQPSRGFPSPAST